MATAVGDSIPLTGDARIDGLLQGGSWQFSGATTLSYSFSLNTEPDDPAWASYAWLSTAFAQALGTWSSVANISFVESGSGGSVLTSPADIAVVIEDFGDDSILGLGIFPDPAFGDSFLLDIGYDRGSYPNPEGDIDLNIGSSFLLTAEIGSLGFETLVHEIGHALGLKHPHDGGANGRPTYAGLGLSAYDSVAYTVMSYNSPDGMSAGSPMLYDILAIQQIYGANMSYRTGNDTYAVENGYFSAIWDAGGTDTIDAAGWAGAQGVAIDLRPGAFSGTRDGAQRMAIAFGTTIENATGTSLADRLIGNDVGNVLDGGGGVDWLEGHGGDDTYYVDDQGDVVVEASADGGFDTVRSTASSFRLEFHLERLELLGSGDIDGEGNHLDNVIVGTSGANLLKSGSGGADTLIGGLGDDIYEVTGVNDAVLEDAAGGIDTVRLFQNLVDYTLPAHVERLALFSDFAAGIGNELDNRIDASAGNNVIDGGLGADEMAGGDGYDVYYVDNAADVVIEIAAPLSIVDDEIRTSVDYALPDYVERLTLIGDAAEANGNSLDNVLLGNALANRLYGHGGEDTLDGGGGADILYGGSGNDLYRLNASLADIVELDAEGIDSVLAELSYALGDHVEQLRLAGSGDFSGTGNALDNLLVGNAGHNTLDGGAGSDTLRGGQGDDRYIVDSSADQVSEQLPHSTYRASTNVDGFAGSENSWRPSISGNGRYVVFDSNLNNLDPGDVNFENDIYIKDVETGVLRIVSTTAADLNVESASYRPTVSDDGRYVVFENVGGLHPADTSMGFSILRKDLLTGNLDIVSSSSEGVVGNDWSSNAAMTGDARFVAFDSTSQNLVGSDTNGLGDVFVKDLQSGAVVRASVADDEAQGNGFSQMPWISANGRYVVFQSAATNLVSGDSNAVLDVFVRDLQAGTTTRASTASGGQQADGASSNARISADGRYVAFESAASNLASGDTNGVSDVFVKDLTTGAITLVSRGAGGTQGNAMSVGPSISGDGRFIAFASLATNLVAGDTNARQDVFVVDRISGQIERVSIGYDGSQGAFASQRPAISSDGRFISFEGSGISAANGPLLGGSIQIYSVPNPFADEGGSDTVESSASFTLSSFVERLILTGTSSIDGTGNTLDNLLRGNAAANTLNGGAGIDTADYGTAAGAVVAELWRGTANNDGYGSVDTLIGIENLIGSALGDGLAGNGAANRIEGGAGADQLYGGSGNDVLLGGTGGDRLAGDAGADSLDGGEGTDTAVYSAAPNAVVAELWRGTANNDGYGSVDTLVGIENLVGSAFGDGLAGNGGANRIEGGGGADLLYGASGNDMLLGGAGDDRLFGDAGADALDGGEGTDTASYGSAPAAVSAELWRGSATNDGYGAIDTFVGIENLIGSAFHDGLAGNGGANRIEGGLGADFLYGAAGNDTLLGGSGSDRLSGDAGADILDGGEGTDAASYGSAAAGVVAELWRGSALNDGHGTVDTFVGIENLIGSAFNDGLAGDFRANRIEGGGGNDQIYGASGDDTLLGGAGDDRLFGDAGTDTLSGEGGADTFSFSTALASAGIDLITDFLSGTDRLQLENAVFQAFALPGAVAAGSLALGTVAADADDYLLYDASSGFLYYDADANGAGSSLHFATLSGLPAVTAADFLIV